MATKNGSVSAQRRRNKNPPTRFGWGEFAVRFGRINMTRKGHGTP